MISTLLQGKELSFAVPCLCSMCVCVMYNCRQPEYTEIVRRPCPIHQMFHCDSHLESHNSWSFLIPDHSGLSQTGSPLKKVILSSTFLTLENHRKPKSCNLVYALVFLKFSFERQIFFSFIVVLLLVLFYRETGSKRQRVFQPLVHSQLALTVRTKLIQIWEQERLPGRPGRFRISRTQTILHCLAVGSKLDWKWISQDMNQHPYGTLSLAGARLACYGTSQAQNLLIF